MKLSKKGLKAVALTWVTIIALGLVVWGITGFICLVAWIDRSYGFTAAISCMITPFVILISWVIYNEFRDQ